MVPPRFLPSIVRMNSPVTAPEIPSVKDLAATLKPLRQSSTGLCASTDSPQSCGTARIPSVAASGISTKTPLVERVTTFPSPEAVEMRIGLMLFPFRGSSATPSIKSRSVTVMGDFASMEWHGLVEGCESSMGVVGGLFPCVLRYSSIGMRNRSTAASATSITVASDAAVIAETGSHRRWSMITFPELFLWQKLVTTHQHFPRGHSHFQIGHIDLALIPEHSHSSPTHPHFLSSRPVLADGRCAWRKMASHPVGRQVLVEGCYCSGYTIFGCDLVPKHSCGRLYFGR